MEALTPTEMMILDTCFWIALLDKSDSCYKKAAEILENIDSGKLYMPDYVYGEILTVLRNKDLESELRQLVVFIKALGLEINFTSEIIFNVSSLFFFKYKKLSFIDCVAMATAKVNKANLLTFDKQLQKAWDLEQNAH